MFATKVSCYCIGSMRAEERLAAFLLNLSQRFGARGYSPTHFQLRMSRQEIGSYLGLTLETVSRAFSSFKASGLINIKVRSKASGLINIKVRSVEILDLEQLDAAISQHSRYL